MAVRAGHLAVTYLRIARPYNALLPILAVLIGFAAADGSSWTQCGLAAVALFLAHSAVTVWNDISDARDDKNNGIVRIGLIKKQGLYGSLITLNLFAVILTYIFLFFIGSWQSIALCSVYFALGWLYNANPFRLSKRPVSSMLILALAYGLVPFTLGAVLGHVTWYVWVLAIAWTLSRVSLSLLKDYKDAKGDAKSNKKTFLLVYGARNTALLSIILFCCSLVLVGASGWVYTNNEVVVAITTLVGIWLLAERWRLRSQQSYVELNKTFHNCLHYQLLFDGLVLGWLLI